MQPIDPVNVFDLGVTLTGRDEVEREIGDTVEIVAHDLRLAARRLCPCAAVEPLHAPIIFEIDREVSSRSPTNTRPASI